MEAMVTSEFWRGKRVLITGHTGFKGAWLSLWLKLLGADLVGYALDPPSQPNLFASLRLDQGINHIHGDVRDPKHVLQIFRAYRPEIVFHLAAQALVRLSYAEPRLTYETNIMGTVNILEAVRESPEIKAVVIVTSDKCYENREWIWGYRENEPMGGHDPYSSSKGAAEIVTNAYKRSFFSPDTHGQTHQVGLASVRSGNVIGGGDWGNDRLLPDCIKALHNHDQILIRYPEAVRPWQFVLEPLRGYLLVASALYQRGPAYSEAWNFGPDDRDCLPVGKLVQTVIQKWSPESHWQLEAGEKLHEAHFLKLDCSKAKRRLGWSPWLTLDETLTWTVDWYKTFYDDVSFMRSFTENQILTYQQLGRS